MEQWLIRTSSNVIAGPYTRDQVVGLIRDGKLGLQDEVCEGNGYWISLHEHLEVESQLGIRVPRAAASGTEEEEVTETQTESLTLQERAAEAALSLAGDGDGSTSVSIPRRQRSESPAANPAFPSPARSAPSPRLSVSPSIIERPSVWRGFVWLLIVSSCAIVVMVLRLLRSV